MVSIRYIKYNEITTPKCTFENRHIKLRLQNKKTKKKNPNHRWTSMKTDGNNEKEIERKYTVASVQEKSFRTKNVVMSFIVCVRFSIWLRWSLIYLLILSFLFWTSTTATTMAMTSSSLSFISRGLIRLIT